MPLCSCSEACCQPSWHPSNQIHSKNLTPNLLDAAWPRIKDVGPYLQSLVKRLKDTGSKAKHTMPHKSISHSPNGHRPTPSEWNSFLGLGFSVILCNKYWRTHGLCTLFSTLSTAGKPTLLIIDRSGVQWQRFLSYCQPWPLAQCKDP